MTKGLERYLDNVELQATRHPVALVVRYEGHVDLAGLEDAYRLLCVRHPVLRARIHPEGDRHLLEVPQWSSVDVVVRSGGSDEEHLRRIGLEWRIERELARLLVVERDGGGSIAFFADHAIADGMAKSAYLAELWALYVQWASGRRPEVRTDGRLPAAPVDVLRDRLGDHSLPEIVKLVDPDDYEGTEAVRRYITLSPRATADLVATAKAIGTTVNAILCAAVLLAQRRQFDGRDPVDMLCWAPVDLRRRMEPAVGATETTNFIGMSPVTVLVGPDSDLVRLARTVRSRLEAVILNQQPLRDLFARTSGGTSPPVGWNLTNAAVSNLGVVRGFPPGPGARIAGFEVYSHAVKGATPSYVAYTYDGCLGIEAFYRSGTYSVDQVESLVDELKRQLAQATALRGGNDDHPRAGTARAERSAS
ncbi:hypothetical protein GCM10017786_34710 [Amycolatopsis deserti]|uniref:Phthiocerol/phthiodiolone dimycocerosyl transferase n=1 Tax=Amycolatopsis deserti TaxID=185696 RepID=A0ABQ3J0L5_9PSEU|nr:hypothetical protein [Amycolatopsis deserti]GHE98813.1 hypothetical protein GCM10017786_34710 [Amycolatopsis deserti]